MSIKNYQVFCLLIILTFSMFGFAQSKDYKELINKKIEDNAILSASHILIFHKIDNKMMDSGLNHVYEEKLFKVQNAKGAKALKSIIIPYDPLSAFVEFKEVKIYRKNGKIINVSLDKVKDYVAPARAIYWGAKEKMIPIGALEPGDGVYVKTYKKGYTYALLQGEEDERYIPPMKGHFYDIVPFYSNIPVLEKSYNLSIPKSKDLQYQFYNGTASQYCHNKGDRMLYSWSMKNIKPLKREPNMVGLSDVAPKLLLSTAGSWQEKSLWFYGVNEDYGSFKACEGLVEKVNEIIKGAKTDIEKVTLLTRWVANKMRYSGLSMGKGEGYTLHNAKMNFTDRCGVCKDKAGMLIAMLRAAGFESYPAMTMAGSRIDRIPADQFNHCVTVVKLNGKYQLLDPTWVPGSRELWSSYEQQQEYLMGIPNGADLKSTPISDPKNHYLKYNIKSSLNERGDLRALVKISAEGTSDTRFRRMIKGYPKGQTDKFFAFAFSQVSLKAKVTRLKYTDAYNLNKNMELSFILEIPGYAKQSGGKVFVKPLSGTLPFERNINLLSLNTRLKTRKYPFRLSCSQQVLVKEEFELPKSCKLLTKKPYDTVKKGNIIFKGTKKMNGKTLLIKKEIIAKKRIYQASDYENAKKAYEGYKKSIEELLVFKGGLK